MDHTMSGLAFEFQVSEEMTYFFALNWVKNSVMQSDKFAFSAFSNMEFLLDPWCMIFMISQDIGKVVLSLIELNSVLPSESPVISIVLSWPLYLPLNVNMILERFLTSISTPTTLFLFSAQFKSGCIGELTGG